MPQWHLLTRVKIKTALSRFYLYVCRGRELNPRRHPLPKISLDYIISVLNKYGVGRFTPNKIGITPLRDSLYTFPTLAGLGSGLFFVFINTDLPRIHPIFQSALLRKAPKSLGMRSTTELPRQLLTFKTSSNISVFGLLFNHSIEQSRYPHPLINFGILKPNCCAILIGNEVR